MILASFNQGGDMKGIGDAIAAICIGFFVLLVLIVIFGGWHIARTRKREREAAQEAKNIIDEM